MPVLITPGPVRPPTERPPTFGPGLTLWWDAPDGTNWNLTDVESGVSLGHGVRGLAMPPVQTYEDESPAVDGTVWRGMRVAKRPVMWPLRVFTGPPGSQAWLDYDRAFWSTMDPTQTGVWRVVQPDGAVRSLTVRYVDDNDHFSTVDPTQLGWERYQVTLQAERPYWQGVPVVREFQPPDDQPFFVVGTGGVIHISPGNAFATATIDNPGEVPAYLTYYLTGPITSADVRGNEFPNIDADEGIVLRTAPFGTGAQSALEATVAVVDGERVFTLTGVDRTPELGEVNFAPIAPGQSVPVDMTVAGTGYVRVELTPDYYRAW